MRLLKELQWDLCALLSTIFSLEVGKRRFSKLILVWRKAGTPGEEVGVRLRGIATPCLKKQVEMDMRGRDEISESKMRKLWTLKKHMSWHTIPKFTGQIKERRKEYWKELQGQKYGCDLWKLSKHVSKYLQAWKADTGKEKKLLMRIKYWDQLLNSGYLWVSVFCRRKRQGILKWRWKMRSRRGSRQVLK